MSIDNSSLLDYFDEISEGIWKRDKKFQTLVLKSKYGTYNTIALYHTNWLLEGRYNNILKLFIKNKEMNVTQAAEVLLNDITYKKKLPDIDEENHNKKIGRYITDLKKWKLLKVSREETVPNIGNKSPYYELSLNGLFYILLHWTTGELHYHNFFKDLAKNHIDNILFKLFVLPYFERTTIVSSAFSNSRSDTFLLVYLKEICEAIIQNKRLIFGLRNSGYDDKSDKLYLFSWPLSKFERDSIYYTQFDNFRSGLRPFLINKIGWEWIKNAKILPNYDDRKITIETHGSPSKPYIVIDVENMKSYLRDEKYKYDFIVEKNSYSDILVISTKTINNEPMIMKINEDFKKIVFERLANLILMIMNREFYNNKKLKDLLMNDNKFKNSIRNILNVLKFNDC